MGSRVGLVVAQKRPDPRSQLVRDPVPQRIQQDAMGNILFFLEAQNLDPFREPESVGFQLFHDQFGAKVPLILIRVLGFVYVGKTGNTLGLVPVSLPLILVR